MSQAPARSILVLWDIDHTLIETRGLGRELYRRAFEEATGRAMERAAQVTGRTELTIFTETLKLHGITPSPKLTQRYAEALARQYRENVDTLRDRGRALPGAAQALAALAEHREVLQSVLTGNLRQVAATKLHAFGLDGHIDFEIGAYGDDQMERQQLVHIAQRRAHDRTALLFGPTNTVLVGDSVEDVAAGREGGAAVVAVASGDATVDELVRAGASATVYTLTSAVNLIEQTLHAHQS